MTAAPIMTPYQFIVGFEEFMIKLITGTRMKAMWPLFSASCVSVWAGIQEPSDMVLSEKLPV